MVEEIVCTDCGGVFFDWWDAYNHVCRSPATTQAGTPDAATILLLEGVSGRRVRRIGSSLGSEHSVSTPQLPCHMPLLRFITF
jgi:hypothetical protein